MQSPRSLASLLKKDASNFDLLRLIAALAVIVGHGYAISPQPPLQDGILSLLHFDYSGSLAVKFFFFLSGLLVTNSIIQKPDAFHFLIKRACRIFPGLFVCLLVAVLIIGPLFTKLPLSEYLSNAETWKYIPKNLFLYNMQWRLPGVFTGSPFGLNGSLWTLPSEVLCYLYLAVLFGLAFLRNRIVANIFFAAVVGVAFIAPRYLPDLFSQNPEAQLLPACFAIGALFANNKGSIDISLPRVFWSWLFVILVSGTAIYQFAFYIAFFYTAVFVSSLDLVIRRLKLPFDASYGVYIYGFMIQQCVHAVFPGMGVHGNQTITILVALVLGVLSWYIVEKRFIDLGHRIGNAGYQLQWKDKLNRFLKFNLPDPEKRSSLARNNFLLLLFFTGLAFIVHALVLKFIFPGYYSPLYPQHSDFYIPAAFAHSNDSFISLLSWPRPVNMVFAKLIGYTGIQGSIACVIILVWLNCALTALLIKQLLKQAVNLQLIVVFIAYCYLLFSSPYFYIFYVQDIGVHLSYFFLILGAIFFYSIFERHAILAGSILFVCGLLAFLSKETYGLGVLFICLVWFLYYRKTSLLKAGLPLIAMIAALALTLVHNLHIRSEFVNPNATATDPYHISLNPMIVLREFRRYAKEAMNVANLALIFLLGYLFYRSANENKNSLLLLTIAGVIGAILCWVPNSILPNHHYTGYSFNGAYLLFLPLLLFPAIWAGRHITRSVVFMVLLLCFISPLLNGAKYKDNDWVLIQEDTQRNLLTALDPLMAGLHPSPDPQKVLIEGISFPFHPFAFPQSLRTFPNARYANFDVVNYGLSPAGAPRNDLVKFIDPSDTGLADYQQKWVFDKNGNLVNAENLAAEKIFNSPAGTKEKIRIGQDNFSRFVTTGFYGAENGIRWTDGKATINLDLFVTGSDSIFVELDTYMPPICKDVSPRLLLSDSDDKTHGPRFSSRKENTFYYLFVMDKKTSIRKIELLSETVDASPDQRILSFPFMSLEMKTSGTSLPFQPVAVYR